MSALEKTERAYEIQTEMRRLPMLTIKEKIARTITRGIEQMKPYLPQDVVDDAELIGFAEKEFAKSIIKDLQVAYRL